MRPISGTGHSTSPATSSSRPGSSTTASPSSAARPRDAVGDHPLALGRHPPRRGGRAASAAQSAQDVTANAPGARKRWPSVRSAAASPCPSSSPSRRSNGTTCAVQQADDPAQRAHPGEGAGPAPAHGFRPREPAQQRRERRRPAPPRGSPGGLLQHPKIAFLAQLRRARRRACAGTRPAPAPARAPRPALLLRLSGDARRYRGAGGDAPRAVERAHRRGAQRRQRLAQQPRTDRPPPAPASAPGFPR